MTEEQQITDAFMKDFEDLLCRYHATFEIEYADDDAWAVIEFPKIYDYEKDELVRSYEILRLPYQINPN